MAALDRKALLISELARARSILADSGAQLTDDFDIQTKLKASLEGNRGAWIGGAAGAGLLLAAFGFRRTKTVTTASRVGKGKRKEALPEAEKAGLLAIAGKMAFDMAKPMLIGWVTSRLRDYVERSAQQGAPNRYAQR